MKLWLKNYWNELKYYLIMYQIMGLVFMITGAPLAYFLTEKKVLIGGWVFWTWLVGSIVIGEYLVYRWDKWAGKKLSIISQIKDDWK